MDDHTTRVTYCTKEFGPGRDYRLIQFGDLDLQFTGWKISSVGEENLRPDRSCVAVTTYFTVKGSYVGEVTRRMPNRIEGQPHIVKSKAGAFASPKEMLNWLREDGRGWLGENSKVAWEEMCAKLPWLRDQNSIRV